jgi:methionyl aminopeptidase
MILKEGDIISIDVGAKFKGYHGDAARSFPVGKIDPKVKRLIKITEQSFFEGIKGLKSGAYVGDISNRVQTFVEKNGYSVVRELVGHGVGKDLHEDPNVPNFGRAGSGPRLTANMIIAIEPMVNMGERNVVFLPDGWTCKTRDGMPSAHYENTVLITEDGVEILTL